MPEIQKELIINKTPAGIEIALLEDGVLMELHHEDNDNQFSIGDVYIGKTRRIVGSLKAAFIDIGHEKDAFLHYTDLGPQMRSLMKYVAHVVDGKQTSPLLQNFETEPDIVKNGKIEDVLDKRYPILVQIFKEPISSKGPRLTSELTLAGRYIVLSPFYNHVSVSKKIKQAEERQRLQRLAESIKPANFGLIIRTAAEGKKTSELHEDIQQQVERWGDIFNGLKKGGSPKRILSEVSKTSGILRDMLNDSFKRIVVNDKNMAAELRHYIREIAPEQEKIIVLHGGTSPVFDQYKVTKQIKSLFGKTVTLPSGAYLVVEHTEAMHVIDVNSGHKVGGTNSNQDLNALAVNLEAAAEIARQLRLRDLGGLVVIDFIDLKDPEHKGILQRRMAELMQTDRARHTILPLSKFGLMQITRERVRPEINISTAETCPTCKGTGKVKPTILFIDDLENNLSYFLTELDYHNLTLVVHPFVEAFIKKGIISRQWKWFWKFKKWTSVTSNGDFHLSEYKIFDGSNEEIKL